MPRPIVEPVHPTPQDIALADRAYQELSSGHISLVQLPEFLVTMITQILSETAHGRSISIVPAEADMTTTEAADYLNVSRPYIVRLLSEGKIAFHRVGTHKRIDFNSLKAYKADQKKRSFELMAQLQEEAQELGLGY